MVLNNKKGTCFLRRAKLQLNIELTVHVHVGTCTKMGENLFAIYTASTFPLRINFFKSADIVFWCYIHFTMKFVCLEAVPWKVLWYHRHLD